MRRRLAALGVVGAVVALTWFAISSVAGNDEEPPMPTTTAALARPKPLKIVFPEGFTRREMAARISAVNEIAERRRNVQPRLSEREYLAHTARSTLPASFAGDTQRRPLEGFLFPATYEFTAKTTTAQLVRAQLKAFQRNWEKVDLRYARSKNLTPYDVLIIASMVEKEAAAPEERQLIAAVIYNRLKAGMSLGIDATVRYGLGVPATESLRQSHLKSTNPYNTRKRVGLTPTPIANPGLASMQAAAHPARVNYLYFVRKPDKVHHFFTDSQREFENYKNAHGYG